MPSFWEEGVLFLFSLISPLSGTFLSLGPPLPLPGSSTGAFRSCVGANSANTLTTAYYTGAFCICRHTNAMSQIYLDNLDSIISKLPLWLLFPFIKFKT